MVRAGGLDVARRRIADLARRLGRETLEGGPQRGSGGGSRAGADCALALACQGTSSEARLPDFRCDAQPCERALEAVAWLV